jgi:Domain of unknown function (DUF4082)/Bacterial Ig-like domain
MDADRGRGIAASAGGKCVVIAVLTALTALLSSPIPPGYAQTCPCSIWPSTAVPEVPNASDTASVEIGVKFRSDVAGFITAIRFYKGPLNTSTHTGSLWTATGTLLGSATFTNETASGWQQVTLPTPVAITANTIYVASYFAPAGRYAFNQLFFASAGVDNPPLHAVANSVSANGIYSYSASSTFPNQTFDASNYWVDVVFTTTSSDTTPPTMTSMSPANGATGVGRNANVTATFSEAMDAASMSTSTFELRHQDGTLVPAAVTYDATTRVATLNPTQTLQAGITYTATVRGGPPGAKDAAGNPLAADVVWFFKRSERDTRPPAVTAVSPADGGTGVSPTSTVTATFDEAMLASTITTTTFALRDAADALVPSTVAYNASTRVATLTPSAALAAGATYRATILGGASGVKDLANNALAANRTWSFTTAGADSTPPTVTAFTPPGGAAGVSVSTAVTATFSEPMQAATISTDSFDLRVGTTVVPATVSYNATTRVATLTPTSPLAAATTYTATVRGGATDPRVKDLAGNALASNFTWSFSTAAGSLPPAEGPGGPILVVTTNQNQFSKYYAEILRAEGLNFFSLVDISAVTAQVLAAYDVVILGQMPLTPSQVTMLTDWVTSGGNLIAMRPDKQLAPLLGLSDAGTTLSNAYLLVDRRGDRGAEHPVQRHRRPICPERGHVGRDALLDGDRGDHEPRALLEKQCRRARWAGGGVHVRSRPSDSCHSPGKCGVVRPGTRRLRARAIG